MFEKMRELIAEQLNCDADSITMETNFKDDLGEIPWTCLSWL